MTALDKLTNNVKIILEVSDTTLYDELLAQHIPSSISKLEIAGISWEKVQADVDTFIFYQYSTCIAWLCKQLLDDEVNAQLVEFQYVANANQLRLYYGG